MNKRQAKKIKQREFMKLITSVGKDDVLIFEYNTDKARHSDIHDGAIQIVDSVENKAIFINRDVFKLKSKRSSIETIEILENYIYELRKGL